MHGVFHKKKKVRCTPPLVCRRIICSAFRYVFCSIAVLYGKCCASSEQGFGATNTTVFFLIFRQVLCIFRRFFSMNICKPQSHLFTHSWDTSGLLYCTPRTTGVEINRHRSRRTGVERRWSVANFSGVLAQSDILRQT